jgi:hypothetical protein
VVLIVLVEKSVLARGRLTVGKGASRCAWEDRVRLVGRSGIAINLMDGQSRLLSAAARPHLSLASARLRNLFHCPSQWNVEQCSPSLRDRIRSASAVPEPPRDSRRRTHHPPERFIEGVWRQPVPIRSSRPCISVRMSLFLGNYDYFRRLADCSHGHFNFG